MSRPRPLLRPLALVAGAATLVVAGGRPCVAQQVARDSVVALSPAVGAVRGAGGKDSRLAFVLGAVSPGLGHHYTGEHTRGVLIEAGTLGAMTGSMYYWSRGMGRVIECAVGDSKCTAAAERRIARFDRGAQALMFTAVGIWIYGAVDAPFSARRVNARRESDWARGFAPAPVVGVTPSGAVFAGATLRVR